jgi:HSP20 family protein
VSFTDPFDALFALQRALDSRLASDWMGGGTAAMGSYPPINMFQQGDDFVAILEIPGVDRKDLTIEAKESTIRISGKKTVTHDESASAHRRERVGGTFNRTLSVPVQMDPDGIKAEYRDGLLALFIARAESDKPRTIKIK